MPIKKSAFAIRGMTRDTAVSKFSSELAYENKNLRIIATDDNTSYGLVNEKGTAPITITGLGSNFIDGTPIGQEVINDTLVLFTTAGTGERMVTINVIDGQILDLPELSGEPTIETTGSSGDSIYTFKVGNDNTLTGELLYSGDLGFDISYPIESIGVYENEQLQKVYWTDGLNQPRVINIVASQAVRAGWTNGSFNFVRKPALLSGVSITRNIVSFGNFAPGVIQYCFTYYDLYGPETNIVYTSPLYYVSHTNRGASPEDTVSCSFNITVNSPDHNFDYLRIYSILRTSLDATPQVRKVVDIAVKDPLVTSISYVDTGVQGESIDPTSLLYIGGELIVAGTMAQKDNTLFLGDITMGRNPIDSTIKTASRGVSGITYSEPTKILSLPDNRDVGYYGYTSQLSNNNKQITYFRKGETYRLGFQAQHSTGKWSEVVFMKDHTVARRISESSGNMLLTNIQAVISNSTILSGLVDDGYVAIRPVVVLPDGNNRSVICQGVLNPTVYNAEDRYNNAPYAQASWFFRPNHPINYMGDTENSGVNSYHGKVAEFRHNRPIPGNLSSNSEIQCIPGNPPLPRLEYSGTSPLGSTVIESRYPDSWVANNRECFYVDQSVVTLNSPDIEFDNELKDLDMEGGNTTGKIKLRIVGYIPFDASYSDIDIEATTPSNYAYGMDTAGENYKFWGAVAPGFTKIEALASTSSGKGWRCLLSSPMWFDSLNKCGAPIYPLPVPFVVYPWHRSGALNNARDTDSTSRLQHKKMSVLRFSKNSKMLADSSVTEYTGLNISSVAAFNSDQVSMVKVKSQNSGTEDLCYYGNIDKLVTVHSKIKGIRAGDLDLDAAPGNAYGASAYPITCLKMAEVYSESMTPLVEPDWIISPPSTQSTDLNSETYNVHFADVASTASLAGVPYTYLAYPEVISVGECNIKRYIFNDSPTCSTDPVSIKYKSSPHIVMAFAGISDDTQRVLPTHINAELDPVNGCTDSTATKSFFWNENLFYVSQDAIPIQINTGYLWLGELYRDVDSSTRFGGTSDEAIENNNWIPAGEPVSIVNSDGTAKTSATLLWQEGDTYYQRYDCLKTYPFTLEDTNSVTDILSFMCETRINIDGRYDRNRGTLSNLYTTRETFNHLNPVYSQHNNFFNYRGSNPNKITGTIFPNTITWSKTKTMGETVDTWTNVTLASTLDMDGDKGRVRAIRRFNDSLLSFQDRAISQILYNENVQIATSTGVPIEIANSGKVSGKRYISNHIGCVNKWSICSAPSGIYFMDDIGKDIYVFNGQLGNISDKLGFHSWVISNFPDIKIWNPRDFDSSGEITYYDKVNGDVMFITGQTCLNLSEPLGNFSSFYSYEGTPYFATLQDKGVLWHKDTSLSSNDSGYDKYRAWWYREGEYNYFFNTYQPFYTTVVANENPLSDKIFNNLEYRGDTFDASTEEYLYLNTFDYLETWNEYQKGTAQLVDNIDFPSTLKKKFRIWRANIPRNNTNQGGDSLRRYTRDRMRNPWLYIKLAKNTPNNYKTILHDLVVYYFE